MADPLLRMENIVKTFPGVLANDQVNLEVERGEIHALLGENGAGKTTLMNVLYGIYRPDGGKIVWKGQEVDIRSSRDAIGLGIGMVHQHFMLVPPFTVTENVVLGLEQPHAPLVDTAGAEKKILELGHTYGLPIDPKAYVWQLPVGVQQRVEIIKALYRQAELLILDEPTAVLTPGEVKDLFGVLRGMTAKGLSIIFITHKLEEVMAATDRVTILRDGKVIDTVRTANTSRRQLAKMMVGRDVVERLDKPQVEPGRPILQVQGVHALNNRDLPALKGVSFDVCSGEILGIAGVDGNGQSQLAEVITGLRQATSGKVIVDGTDATNAQPRDLVELQVAHIPEDRQTTGLVMNFSLTENLVIGTYYRPPFSKRGFLDLKYIANNAQKLLKSFDVRTPSAKLEAKKLSGGNQQKVVLAREMSRDPKLFVAVQPTRGLDVGATEYVHQRMLELRSRGCAILLISTELEEIFGLSDRIAVMYEGEIMGIVPGDDVDVEQIGLLMAGVKSTAPEAAAQAMAQAE
jgi:general nucleoside transport system ATP-binding protein